MTVLLMVLIAAAGTIVFGGIIAGLVSFSSGRARAVMHHENEISTADYTPPGGIPTSRPTPVVVGRRIDRHTYYIGVLMALWFAGVGIMLVPIGTGALGTMDMSTQKLLAFALILGSSLSLLGSSLGPPKYKRWWNPMRWWFPNFKEEHAYGVGAGGQIALGVGLGFFGWTVLTAGTLIGTVTGLLTPILSVCAFKFGRQLWDEHKRLDGEWWELRRAATGEGD